jgi:fibronectin-binding autotransporter adhesin
MALLGAVLPGTAVPGAGAAGATLDGAAALSGAGALAAGGTLALPSAVAMAGAGAVTAGGTLGVAAAVAMSGAGVLAADATVPGPFFVERYEGGTQGATVTTSNTGWSSFSSASLQTFDNAHSVSGGLAVKVAVTANTAYATKTFTAASLQSQRFYLWMDALPSAATLLARLLSGTTERAALRMNADGTITVRNALVATGTATGALPLGQWVRLEWKVDGPGGVQELRAFWGANIDGTVPNTAAGSPVFTNSTFDTYRLGSQTAADWTVWYDDVALSDLAAYPAPTLFPATVGMAAAGALGAAAGQAHGGAVAMTAGGTLAAGGLVTKPAAVSLSGSGSLSATSAGLVSGGVTFTAGGTLTAAGARVAVSAATLSADGTMTAAGLRTAVSGVTLSAAGALLAAVSRTTSGSVPMAAAGALTVGALLDQLAAVSLSADGLLTVSGTGSPPPVSGPTVIRRTDTPATVRVAARHGAVSVAAASGRVTDTTGRARVSVTSAPGRVS